MRVEQASTLLEASKKLMLSYGVYSKDRFFHTHKLDFSSNPSSEELLDKVFYISGSSPFKKSIIAEIKKQGGMIDKQLRDNCDYFVALTGCDPMKLSSAKRRRYVKIMTEAEVLKLLYDN